MRNHEIIDATDSKTKLHSPSTERLVTAEVQHVFKLTITLPIEQTALNIKRKIFL